MNQYANQGTAFMSNLQEIGKTDTYCIHPHIFTPQTTVWLQGISSSACVTSKISNGAKSH